ncbi:metal ABC transporter permease [Mycolicibacterium palauense]|uniref:metal ABC transporter permease n=1 Tax=Mycolicibacterium palauense TaxID=2034511 RepID=UPI000BFECA27|nr:metal ABC transporter permease [Mycolicibacterium palauense]
MSPIAFLLEYTFRQTVIGTALIGLTAGALGPFLYLRGQSLLSDVIGHSATGGVMGAFVVASVALGVDGRSMLAIIIGALISGLLAVVLVHKISTTTTLGADAVMAVMLSLFFGGGLVILQWIQRSTLPQKGGIESIMFGNAATLTRADIVTVAVIAAAILLQTLILWRPLALLTFDSTYSASVGLNVAWLSRLQFAAIVLAAVMGIKAVGLVLIIAFTIIPPAAARQWSNSLATMVMVSGAIGAGSAMVGSYLSIMARAPTGPFIVLVLTAAFAASLVLSPNRNVFTAIRRRRARLAMATRSGDSR